MRYYFIISPIEHRDVNLRCYRDGPSDIHLRSLATGMVHPSASNPTIASGGSPIDVVVTEVQSSEVCIYGDLVGWLLSERNFSMKEISLKVWNWKTGQLIAVRLQCSV